MVSSVRVDPIPCAAGKRRRLAQKAIRPADMSRPSSVGTLVIDQPLISSAAVGSRFWTLQRERPGISRRSGQSDLQGYLLAIARDGHFQLGVRPGTRFIQRRGQCGFAAPSTPRRGHWSKAAWPCLRWPRWRRPPASRLAGRDRRPHVHHGDGRRPVLQTPGSRERPEREILHFAVLAVPQFGA